MTNLPKDSKLYNNVKKYIYNKYPTHSAYRSGLLVKEYKKAYEKKYKSKDAYIGNKTYKKGLARWFKEKWKNQNGEIGYKKTSDIYRPTIRVTEKTPITISELNKKQITTARREKKNKGRVAKFNK
tara:strand:- start:7659 stop:8036 length:378 start_codon:yes stop_codon:yes gene_type:complete